MVSKTTYRVIRTDWNRRHRHKPVKGAKLEIRRDADNETVASWTSDAGAISVELVVGERYRLVEAEHPRWHRARRLKAFEASADPADLPKHVRPSWSSEDADLVLSDRHVPLYALFTLMVVFIVLSSIGVGGESGGVATKFAQQIDLAAAPARPHVRISGATTYLSVEDAAWTASAGDQPLTIRNPATNQSSGKIYDIPLDSESFEMPYEDLPTEKKAIAHISLFWEDDEGHQIDPVVKDGTAVEYDWEFTPEEERGKTKVDLDLEGCNAPETASFVMAEVRLTENQSVDISPCIYLDYDGDTRGLSGQELIEALQDDYEEECVFDPVERDAQGNIVAYNYLIKPGHQVTSIHLDHAPRAGVWDLYVYYTALDTLDHHLCSPGLIGGTKVTVEQR